MNHDHKSEPKASWWFTQDGVVALIFLVFIGYFLITEHWAHVVPYLPYLILLLCPLMHVFHHHGHSGHKHHDKDDNGKGE